MDDASSISTDVALPAPGSASTTTSTHRPALLTSLPAHSFDGFYIRRPRAWLVAILVAYLLVAFSYAVNTPGWQAPDEPAHYNYVKHIASTGSFPVLQMGDYDQELLNILLSSRFSAPVSVSALRYEFHQPPLYYLLATPVYWMTGGSLIALRLFGIFIGACSILLLYLCLELVFPTKTLIVVGATAFAALLPMHVAMLSAVNNDGLAEMLVMAGMLVLLVWMRGRFYGTGYGDEGAVDAADPTVGNITVNRRWERQQLMTLGLLLGLGMLTKMYAYIQTPILLATIVFIVWIGPWIGRRSNVDGTVRPSWGTLGSGIMLSLWTAIPAFTLASIWWIRNRTVYGGVDLLGLTRHGTVVAEQPRTSDWIQMNGWIEYGERAFSFTFQSFWGVFGWMSVFMDSQVYTAFLLFTGILFLGVLWAVVRLISGSPDADMDQYQLSVLGLFGVMTLAVVMAYSWYNIEFVQHQGRYLFWGLLPLATIVALGWREVMQPLQGLITAALTVVVAFGLAMVGYVTGTLSEWTILMAGCFALALLLQAVLLTSVSEGGLQRMPSGLQRLFRRPSAMRMNRWVRATIWALPFILMFVLNLVVPWFYIIPQLVW